MKVFKYFFLIATAILFLTNSVHSAETKQDKLVVGMTSGYAPYVSLNDKGDYEGFDIDLANLVAQKLNRKLVLQDLGSMPSLLVAIQKKKIDAIIWAMSITDARRKEMDMIYYQGEKVTEMPFIFWNTLPTVLAKIDDLAKIPNCTICVEAGSYQDAVIQNYPGVKVRYLDKIADAIMEIKYRKAQSALIDTSLIPRVKEQYPEIKVAYLPLPENQQSFGNGICMNKETKELNAQVQKAITDLTAEGKIAELEKKWKLAQ